MRIFVCLLGALLSISVCFGQITKGNWLIGGNGKLYSYTSSYRNSAYNTDAKFTETDVSTSLGYFFVNKFGVGLRPAFTWTKGHGVGATSGIVTNVKHFVIGPFGRWYFLSSDKAYNILTDVSYQFGINDWPGQSGNINAFSIMTGPAIFLITALALNSYLDIVPEKKISKKHIPIKKEDFRPL